MAQITWKNINAPSFGAANSLFAQSGDQLSQGLESLRGLAQEQTDIANTNYQTGSDQNTAALQQAINSATSQSELDAIDTSQYGAQVDAGAIAASIGDRQDRLADRATEAEKIGIQRSKLALEQKVANQPTIKDDNNGTIWAIDPNTGKQVGSTSYTKQFAPRKGSSSIAFKERDRTNALAYDAFAKSKVKEFPDRAAYQTAMTDYVNQNGGITTAKGNKLIEASMSNYDSYYTLSAEDQILVDQQDSVNNIATVAYNDAISLNGSKLESALGFPAEALSYADDTETTMAEVQKNWSEKFDSFGNGDFPTAYSSMQATLGRAPTPAEFNYIMGQTDQNSFGYITQSDIKDNSQTYKDKILGSPHRAELEEYTALATRLQNDINNRTTAASAATNRAVRSRKASGKAVATTDIDTKDLDLLSTSMDTLILKIADEKAKGFIKITGFE